MINILKAIVTKLGGIDTSEENYVDTFTEDKISNVDGELIASSQFGGIWIKFQELADYQFMNVLVVGKHKHKTFKGCEMVFKTENSELKLFSDTREIESDFTNVSSRWVTQMTFDITNENIDVITNKEFIKVDLIFEKNTESFEILKD
jgi:ribonuclease HI